MREPIIEQKRKSVAIPLPEFSWRFFASLKFFLFLGLFFTGALFAYWFFALRPFLWLDSGRIDAKTFSIRSQETGVLAQMIGQEGSSFMKGALLFSLENSQATEKQKKIVISLTKLQEAQKLHKKQSDQAMQDYLADLGLRPQIEIDRHLQVLQESQTKLEEVQKQIDALEEEKNSLLSQQANFRIAAPCNGVVLRQQKMPGDFVQAGELVLSLIDLNCSWIDAAVPEKNLHQIKVGQPVTICLPAYPGQQWEGAISWIGPATVSKVEGNVRLSQEEMIPIKISLPLENFPVKPGLSAKVGIKIH